mgnify:FL=1
MTWTDAFQKWMEIFEGWGDENESLRVREADQDPNKSVQRVSAEAEKKIGRPRDVRGSAATDLAVETMEEKEEGKVKIEKDVPVPSRTVNLSTTYPWGEMEIGDSFFCEATEEMPMVKRQNSMFSSVAYYRLAQSLSKDEFGISTRRWPKGRPYGIRVWRVK